MHPFDRFYKTLTSRETAPLHNHDLERYDMEWIIEKWDAAGAILDQGNVDGIKSVQRRLDDI